MPYFYLNVFSFTTPSSSCFRYFLPLNSEIIAPQLNPSHHRINQSYRILFESRNPNFDKKSTLKHLLKCWAYFSIFFA